MKIFSYAKTFCLSERFIKIRRCMKLSFLFLFGLCLQVSAVGYSQNDVRLSLHFDNLSISKAISAIEKKSKFHFLYSDDIIPQEFKITLDVKETPLPEIMERVLKNTGLHYKIMENKLIIITLQDKVIKDIKVDGTVTDKTGNPLAGVTVKVKNSTLGTVTDDDGHFVMEVPDDAILIFNSIGYQPMEVRALKTLTISLQESPTALSQVVVVGYGTEKKADLTGAIEQINGKDINSRPVSNIITSLQGLLPGLNIQSNNGNPGASPDINIRGFNSINGGGPLILVDGIEGDIDRVNPMDVESVTVLKDAASAAIYGARGAFGVILITTKKGKEGKTTINYANNIGWTTPTTRTDFISDPYLYGKTVDAALFGYNGTNYTGYEGADWDTIQMVSKGQIAPFYRTLPNGNNKFFYKTNWYDYLFRKWQPFQSHNISVSGGTKKLQAYLSGRYYNTTTIQNIVNAPLKKYNLKANINFQVTDWLQLSDNIQYTTQDQLQYGGYKTGFGGIWSNTTWYNLFTFQPNNIDGVPFDFAGIGAHAALEAKSNWIRNYSEQLVNTFSGKLTPLKGLVLNFDYSNTINQIANTTRLNQFQYLTGAKILLQTTGVNSLTEERDRSYHNTLNIYGTYTKSLALDHHFKLMLGYNQEKYNSDNVSAEQGGLLINSLSNLNLGTNLLLADGSASVWSIQGYFGRFNYDFKNKYLLEVNSRYDGSSRFPGISRWGLFPSVSAGWYLSKEKFWDPLSNIVSSTKLRISYGKLGNQNIGLYTFSQILGLGQTAWLADGNRMVYVGAPAPLPSVVSWEETKTLDYGIDLGFLNNRLTASFDWYKKSTNGMYVPGEPLPGVFGAAEPKENIAALRNVGFEFSVGYHDQFMLAGSPLNFRATASVYNFNGTITKYPNPSGLMSTYWQGEKLGEIYGYHVAGQFQSDEEAQKYQSSFTNPSVNLGQVYNYTFNVVTNTDWKKLRAGDIKYVDINGDGAINKGNNTLANHGDLKPIGNSMPRLPFGFSLGADWKGFDISVAGTGIVHQDWYPTGFIYWGTYDRPYSSFVRKDLVAQAWDPAHPGGKYPQIYRGYDALGANRSLWELNDYYMTNVGYLRVKNLTIGYSLPQSLIQKLKVQQLRVYFSGENILTWRFGNLTRYVDPELAGSGINYSDPGSTGGRADLQDYPLGKTFSFGINLTL